MDLTFSQVTYLYIDNEMRTLDPYCHSIFFKIARHSFGHYKNAKPITKEIIFDGIGFHDRAARDAINALEKRGLIKVERGGGRGRKTEYGINLAYYATFDKPGAKSHAFEGAFSTSDLPLLMSGPEPEKPTGAVTPSPDAEPPAKQVRKQSRKRSDEEQEAFDDTWKAFESAIGCKLTGKDAALEAKSIWEIIDRVNNGNGWRNDLKEIVERFLKTVKNPPHEFEYLRKCVPLPHLLNSSRTWLRFMARPAGEKTPTIDDTKAFFAELKKKGVIA